MRDKINEVHEAQSAFVKHILSLAELSLPQDQFRRFKQLVLERFHDHLKPTVRAALENTDKPEQWDKRCT